MAMHRKSIMRTHIPFLQYQQGIRSSSVWLGPQMQSCPDFYRMSSYPFHSDLLLHLCCQPEGQTRALGLLQNATSVVQHIHQLYSSLAREVGLAKRPGRFQPLLLLGRKLPWVWKAGQTAFSSSFQDALLTHLFVLDVFSFPDQWPQPLKKMGSISGIFKRPL